MSDELHPISSELFLQSGAGENEIVRFSLSCVSETLEKGKLKASGNQKSIYPGNKSIFITKNQKASHNKRFAEHGKKVKLKALTFPKK